MEAWVKDFIPTVLPVPWRRFFVPEDPSAHYFTGHGVRVIFTGQTELDGKKWIHVSLSRADCIPSWKDFREVKDIFIGKNRKAIQVLPKEEEYINDHPYVLHMFSCIDNDALPDFRMRMNGRWTL